MTKKQTPGNQALIEELTADLVTHLLKGDRTKCELLAYETLKIGFSPNMIYTLIFSPAISEIGQLWHEGKTTIAHEHLSTEIIHSLVDLIMGQSPLTQNNGFSVVTTSVEGERHVLASKMFASLLTLEGFSVHYLGSETPSQDLTAYVEQNGIDVVTLSIILESNIPRAAECAHALTALEKSPLILFGGNAVIRNPSYFRAGYVVSDFYSGLAKIESLLGLKSNVDSLNSILSTVGRTIKETRVTRGMNQGDLARKASVDRAYISLVENGKQNLTMSALVNLARALSVPISSIIPQDK